MNTHNIPLLIYKRKLPKVIPNSIISAAIGFFCEGLKNNGNHTMEKCYFLKPIIGSQIM